MNYKIVAKCLGGLSVVFAVATHLLPESLTGSLIREEHQMITDATQTAMGYLFESLVYKNEGTAKKPQASDPCKTFHENATQLSGGMEDLENRVNAATFRLWILDKSYPWKNLGEDRAHFQDIASEVGRNLTAVQSACHFN